jgi:hypothetical protein
LILRNVSFAHVLEVKDHVTQLQHGHVRTAPDTQRADAIRPSECLCDSDSDVSGVLYQSDASEDLPVRYTLYT